MENILLYFAIKYGGDWDKIYAAINKKERVDQEEMDSLLKSHKSEYITLLSSHYPNRLKSIYKPPFVLFYKGDISLLDSNNKTVGVVGSRNHTDYGKDATEKIVEGLVKENIVIVSGMAKGIDSIAHNASIQNNGKTIAVLGNGVDECYPRENSKLFEEIAQKGLILSEYPEFVKANKENFPKRNRIIAGISDAILVTDAKKKSGSMITVSRALEMGKDIFCVPHVIGIESGCNSLIKEGAKLVESAQDILQEL